MSFWDQGRIVKAVALIAIAIIFYMALGALLFVGDYAQGMLLFVLLALVLLFSVSFSYYAFRLYASGKMEIMLAKPQFALGEPIAGTIALHLGKEKKARSLTAFFYGYGKQGGRVETICRATREVSPGGIFMDDEVHRFSIPMPDDVKKYVNAGASAAQPRWFLKAKFDLPGELDVEHEVPVVIIPGEKKGKGKPAQ